MDKFVDYVFKNPDIENNDRIFAGQCNSSCVNSLQFFQYGPEFLQKCVLRCQKAKDEFTLFREKTKSNLEKQIAQCQEKTEGEKVKECILHFQEQAYGNIKDYSEKLYQRFV